MNEFSYSVPGVNCSHCVYAISGEVQKVPGVTDVTVDVDARRVTVRGQALDEALVRAAIDEAGYDITE